MTPVEALHTAARRYCMDRSDMWKSHTDDEEDATQAQDLYGRQEEAFLPEDSEVFPRYNVLDAILVEIERIAPDSVSTTDEMRELLVSAGRTAESPFTRAPENEIENRVMAEERELFGAYIEGLSQDELRAVEPLPYRRVLSSGETERLWSELEHRWGVDRDGYWHPLLCEELPADVIAFDANRFHEGVPPPVLQNILAAQGIRRLWELHEYGPEYEIYLELFEPIYTGSEGYWTAGDMGWLVYASHEGSVTVAGSWLVEAIQAAWPDWEQHVYIEWDPKARWAEHPPKYQFYEVVRVGPQCRFEQVVGLEGAVLSISDEAADRWSYQLYIYCLGETWLLPEEDLEPTGRMDREETFWGEGGVLGDTDFDMEEESGIAESGPDAES
ncbi:MAG: Imm31 family immunity protein [Chloroflexota bacterium]|nr:Imm31 family immunity protein [Chloroflexota bacterium]